MEDIEYLDEYKDLVLPGIKSGATPSSSAGVSRQRRISSDSSNSSSIDADIFQKLFHGKYLDEELLNEGSVSKSQVRGRRRSPSSSSSDDSNDALEALFSRKSGKSKPNRRRERYESFDSVDDLGEALMRPSHRSTVSKPSTSQAGARKSSHGAAQRRRSSNSSGSTYGNSKPLSASQNKSAANPSLSARSKNSDPVVTKSSGSVNGSGLASSKNKSVTIIKAQKTDLTPSQHEPKTDPLTLGEYYGDSDSDSSYEFESDFYGDRDSEDEDAEPVIDISTDTSRTTSVADTVTPVVSDDEGQEPQSEQNEHTERPENDRESVLRGAYERLQSYLSNLSCAEAPPIYKKQSSARKSRSNEKKSSTSEQVKHANEQSTASDKEEAEDKKTEREQEQEAPGASSSAKSSASKTSTNKKLYDVDDSVTLETVERMSLNLAEQIMEIDVERSYEFEKRSGSKTRSRSRSKVSSNLSKSHVRKLTYSSERLDNPESSGTQLRRSKSDSFPKRGRGRSQKKRINRAATTEEKTPNAQEGVGEIVKRKRGRPRKNAPKQEMAQARVTENADESLEQNKAELMKASEADATMETGNSEEQESLKLDSEQDKTKEFAGSENVSQNDTNMTSCHHEKHLKGAPDRDVQLDKEPFENLEEESPPTLDTLTKTSDAVEVCNDITENIENIQDLDEKDSIPEKLELQKGSAVEDLLESNDHTIKNLDQTQNEIEATEDIELPSVLTNVDATGNILEQSDSQLAEDIKLAEEILAAEVGKGIEVSEVSVASVEGGQNPVTEIVKELEQETISEVVEVAKDSVQSEEISLAEEKSLPGEPTSSDDQPPAENQDLVEQPTPVEEKPQAENQNLVGKPTPVKKQTKVEEEPLVEKQTLVKNPVSVEELTLPDKDPPAKDPSPARARSHVQELDSVSKDQPATKEQNLSSPAITPKKLKELEAHESSVSRRALRSDKPSPVKESRPKRPRRTQLALLICDSSRRNSPRLGRSPAESHSSQERSPMENKGAIKFAKEQLTTEKEKEVEEKALPIETDCKEGRDTKATKIEPEIEKVTDSPLKSEKSQMILGTESDKDNLDSIEELPPTSKPAEEYSTSSESEQKDEKLSLETEPAKEKTSNSRKSRRTLLGKVKSECETSEKKPLRTGSKETDLQSETTQSNSLADKEERTSGRLSRRDKAMADAAKPQKDKLPSAKSKSSSKTVISKEKNETKEKDEIKETESDDKASLGKSKTDKKTEQEKSDSDKQANVGSNQKEPKKKGSSRARSKKTIQELTTKSEAVALITDPEAITNKSVQESAEVSVEVIKNRNITDDQKPNEEITETNKEESIMPKIEAVQNTSSAEQDSKVIGKDTSQYFADVFQDISQKSGKTDDEKPNENTTETTYEESLGLNTESVQIPSSSEKVLEPIPTVSAQASDKSNVLKNKSKLRSKKGNTKFKEKISDSDEKEEKVPVQERSSAEKDPVENSQTETADLEHKQDSESTPKGTTQDSDKSNAFKEKPKPRSKKGNKKSKEKISEPDEKEEKDSVQKTNSTENDSVEKSEAETEELKVKPESPVLERARIRKRRQAVVIEDIEPHKDENRVDSSDPQTPASIINEPSLPILEALENVSETSESKVTPLKGKSKTKKGKLSVAAPDHEETTGSLELTHELKEQSVSAHTSIENKETISSPADSQIALPTTPTSSIDQTKNTGSTLKGSSKSKLNVPKLAHKSDKATQRTPKLGSESLTSANQRLLSTPSVSCRNLRVLVKRTPNSFKGTRRSSVFKKTPTKTKRLKALMDGIQKSPSPKRRASEQSISTVATESESIHDQDLLPGSESEPNQNLNNEVPNETPEKVDGGTRDEPKEKEESDQEQETNDKETSDEVDTLIKKGSTENILKEGANALVHESSSLTEANSELHAIKDESPKEENSEEEISKEHSQKEETQEEQSPHDQKPESESAPATDPGGEEPTVKSVAAESETDVTDDEEPAKSPIPDSTETTSVTVEPQPSTSSMLKRSLRKRDADSSQPDEAAKRKQRQMVEKSVTDRQELGKPNRRRHLVEDEERPTNKRTKIASHEKTNVKGKYISIIGNETIMSSTTAPIKEGERTSGGKEINKNVELGPPVRKLLKTDSSSPGGKKPMVQTLLSSTLSLQKPSSGEDGSALTPAKSQKRADAKDKADDQPVLNSSILLTKKSLSANKKTESSKEDGSTAAPRKVNISVSLLPSKGTTAEASKATVSTPVTSPILPRKAQPEAQKMARKSEPHKKAESKNKEAPSEAPKSEVAAGTSKKSVPSALTGRKPIPLPQLELSKKIESRRSDGILPQSSSRKTAPQLDRSKKMLARKSEGAALGANVRKQPIPHPEALKKTETKKPEAPAKAVEPAENDKTVEAEEAQTVVRGRGVTKKTKSEQRMFRSKTGLPTSEAETTSDSRDSSRDDSARSSDKPVPVAPRQVIHSKSVHMTRAASSNRSLAPTPVPTPGRQRNVPKELLTSATDQKRPIQPARTLEQSTRGGAPGGRSRQPAVKRKTVDPLEEDAEVVNPKRPKELLKEDLQQKEDPIRGSAAVAFPVKITVADLSSSADSLAASPMGKADQPKSKIRKVRVRINRQVFTKFLREQQEKIEEINTVSQKLPSPPPPQDATSETDSAAESRSETKLQSQTEPAIVLKPVPASQLLSQPVPNPAPTPASELPLLIPHQLRNHNRNYRLQRQP
ncbi:titin homolog isoform X2 [Drosophila ficusphila]|uniref:titin homolog isoform X2 n=1 Tax=Drosophila ficusphila TaxID=30025 RepID=UPI0007E878C1|nr:titin homolog isoform X2 [Drosophila ficusphila]